MQTPTFHHERELLAAGYACIVGVDEVGAGALAGPVVAAAVVLPLASRLKLIRDSKLLSASQREGLFDLICEKSDAFAIGMASTEEIQECNIRGATLLAMRRAVEQIEGVDFALVDAWSIPGISIPQRGIVRGDQSVKSIAAASIIAKVHRDRLMCDFANDYPEYGFDIHKGYGTKMHREALKLHGPCPIHRTGFRGVLT